MNLPPRDSSEIGPDNEQLGLGEDIDRLCEIGDLILVGHAKLEDFDLKHFEAIFVRGYVDPAGQKERNPDA